MKKSIYCAVAAMILITSCGTVTEQDNPVIASVETEASPSQSNDTVTTPSANNGQAADKEDNTVQYVTLSLPPFIVGDPKSQEEYDKIAKDNGYHSLTLNSDGSLTYEVTPEQKDQLVSGVITTIESGLEEIVISYENFEKITHNDDFTQFEVYTNSDRLSLNDSFSVLNIYMLSELYASITETKFDNTHVDFINASTGDIIDTADSQSSGIMSGTTDTLDSSSTASNEEQSSQSVQDQTSEPAAPLSVPEIILLDQGDVKITAKGIDMSGWMGPELKVLIENNSDKNLTVQTRDSSVNGYMVDTSISSDIVAGKKITDEITFSSSDIKNAGITEIADMEFTFHIFDSDSWENYLDSKPIVVKTSIADTYEYKYDDSGTLVYNANGVKIVVKSLDHDGNWLGQGVLVYINNNTDKNYTVQARDVSVNGFMMDPWFSADVNHHKHAVDDITFLDSDFEDAGIESIDELELKFHVFNADEWTDSFDTDTVLIKRVNGNIESEILSATATQHPEIAQTVPEQEEEHKTNDSNGEVESLEGPSDDTSDESSQGEVSYEYFPIYSILGSGDIKSSEYYKEGGRAEFVGKYIETTGTIVDRSYEKGYFTIENVSLDRSYSHRIKCNIREEDKEYYRWLLDYVAPGPQFQYQVATVTGKITDVNTLVQYEMVIDNAYLTGLEIEGWLGKTQEELHALPYSYQPWDDPNNSFPISYDEIYLYHCDGGEYGVCVKYIDGVCSIANVISIDLKEENFNIYLEKGIALYSQFYNRYALNDKGNIHWIGLESIREYLTNILQQDGRIDAEWNLDNITVALFYNPTNLNFQFGFWNTKGAAYILHLNNGDNDALNGNNSDNESGSNKATGAISDIVETLAWINKTPDYMSMELQLEVNDEPVNDSYDYYEKAYMQYNGIQVEVLLSYKNGSSADVTIRSDSEFDEYKLIRTFALATKQMVSAVGLPDESNMQLEGEDNIIDYILEAYVSDEYLRENDIFIYAKWDYGQRAYVLIYSPYIDGERANHPFVLSIYDD